MACASPAFGTAPSAHGASPQKLYSVVSVPPAVILKTVPASQLSPSSDGCPVEVPVRGLHQLATGLRPSRDVEAIQRGQDALGSDLEDRAAAV